MMQVDLNCDMGESFGSYKIGADENIITVITSANVACGFHAGDATTMRKTVILAMNHSVSIGAHPGFDDLVGFGRRNMSLSLQEIYDLMIYQIGALNGFVTSEGGVLNHVKPHGALYNMAAKNKGMAEVIAEAVYKVNPELILYGLSGSELIEAGKRIGLRTANEVFADRTYQEDGTLTPRTQEGALIKTEKDAILQVLKMVKQQKVITTNGTEIPIVADTICIHGDGENAVRFAKDIHKALIEDKVIVKSL
ncbi:LamB/YcsF family protein [Metabacillus litoralis]|uniref:5-oxoprolinase subunit A n=1 Tax=Metabacillus litoralis TaxID=152268 RepID=A0A5C6VZS0_9BACI|nr:5-oxoprolinase subunit PxpA [Metabacillus litoralis]TXC90527.1 LamB/YcsF family protein [Metabacillus litoralis]